MPLNPDETQQLLIDETAASRQLRAGFPMLRFERELEREFRREQASSRLPQIRFNLYLAIAVVSAFGGLSTLVLGPGDHAALGWLHFGVVLPVLAIAVAITHVEDGRRIYPRFAPLLMPLACLGVVAIELLAARAGVHSLFVHVVIASVFCYYLVGLLFYEALRANAVTWVAYVAFAYVLGVPESQVLYNATALLLVNLVGATAAYGLETVLRTHFLESRLLSEAAARDGLTAIYNRRSFDEHLDRLWQQALRDGANLAVLLVDIDFFKRYNDLHGHQAGDACLRSVAAELARAARRSMDFVARYGGEEFAIILYDPSREYFHEISARVHAGIAARAIPHGDSQVAPRVTVSGGGAFVAPTLDRSPRGFVQMADEALYEAKAAGRNRTVFREVEYADLKTGVFRTTRYRGAA